MKTQRVTLPDGRRLAFCCYGDPAGRTVFYFHGCPGSRLDLDVSRERIHPSGTRIVAVDRPGIGLSDVQATRSLLDWPRDVAALADSLGVERFNLLAVSGGSPYAAACLHAMPGRIISSALVCPLFSLEHADAYHLLAMRHRFILRLARQAPAVLARLCALIGSVIRHRPGLALSFMGRAASQSDRQVLARPAVRKALIRSFQECIRHSLQGVLQDLYLYSRPWGFGVESIRTGIYLWQGLDDQTVPPEMGRLWTRRLPCCTARFLPREGHFSLPIDHMPEIITSLTEYSALSDTGGQNPGKTDC
jgi:pimeloyl-ACP methyl ester carboxylesterase